MSGLTTVAPYECYDRLTTLYENFTQATQARIAGGVDYPWTKFPPGGQSFQFQQEIPTPGISNNFSSVINVNGAGGILVPVGYDGCINMYSANYTGGGFVDGSGDLIWQITQNGQPIKNFENILTERGDPNQPIPVNTIKIYSGQLIQFLVAHPANPALSIGYIICSLGGYFYPNT